MDEYRTTDAADTVWRLARRCNKYIDETTPWILQKRESRGRLNDVLYNLIECIRILAILLKPMMPATSENMLKQIGFPEDLAEMNSVTGIRASGSFPVGTPEPLFARIDIEKSWPRLRPKSQEPKRGSRCPARNVALLPEISYDEFARVDLRVAKVIDCEPVKKSKSTQAYP